MSIIKIRQPRRSAYQALANLKAARAHVQACFDREADLAAQIRAAENPKSVEASF